ncbi:hypothetical protein JOB18_044460 [Solea senegalensis]|uniref:Reverse transcriptase n=1 Tax=Solea senegalensis TaxID=28829 RepID=A0AAV6QII9_SOLSE|nr:hypothetical protein JOB18_044460 [Solea senegalensis]
MKVVWQKQVIPTAWRRVGGVLIPKEKNSAAINQFWQKIFFSMLAHRLTAYLKKNNYIDTSVQKVSLDVASAFGSVPHSLLWLASCFNVSEPITALIKSYFLKIQLCITTNEFTTASLRLEMDAFPTLDYVGGGFQSKTGNSQDPCIASTSPTVVTRRKWIPAVSKQQHLRTTYDVLPSPTNLQQWYGKDLLQPI